MIRRNHQFYLNLLKKQIVLRKIAPYVEEWWNYFLKDIQPRGLTIVQFDESICFLDYGRRRRVRLETKVEGDDIRIFPKFQNHPFFLKAAFFGFGVNTAILLVFYFLLIDNIVISTITKTIAFPLYFCFSAIFLIGSIFKGKGYFPTLLGIPEYSGVLVNLYEAARHAEKRILEQYFP